jgi:hypothetical protein
MPRPALVIVASVTVSAVMLRAADTGSGYFRMHETTSTMTTACGFRVPDPETPGQARSVVVFATVPVDCAAADLSFDPVGTVTAAVTAARGAYVELSVGPEANDMGGSWTQVSPSDSMSFGGQGEVTHQVRTDDRLEGTYSSKGPQSFFDKSFQFELTWAVDLRSGALTGEPLPADGGDPGKAYRSFVTAVAKNDVKGTVATLARVQQDDEGLSDSAGAKAVFDMFRQFELKDARIVGGLTRGDRAVLDVEGTSHSNDKMRGRVLLVREGGAWKVGKRLLRIVFE